MLHVHSGSAEAWALHLPGKYYTSELHSQLRDCSDSLTVPCVKHCPNCTVFFVYLIPSTI